MANNDITVKYIDSEYKLAKEEYKFYAEQFNKQENLYSVFFSLLSILLGAVFIIEPDNNEILLQMINFFRKHKYIPAGVIAYLTVTYAYFFTVMMGNSYYLVLYSEKIVVLEKIINHYSEKKILIWETDIMSRIQSTENTIKKRYINVNILKIFFVAIQYIFVQLLFGTAFSMIVIPKINPWYFAYLSLVIPIFLLWQFYIIWHDLSNTYRNEFQEIYEKELGIKLGDVLKNDDNKCEREKQIL